MSAFATGSDADNERLNYSAIEVRWFSRKTTREQYRKDIRRLLLRCELLEGQKILAVIEKEEGNG